MRLLRFFKKSVLGLSISYLVVFIVLALVFIRFPEIDLWVSAFASDPIHFFHLNHTPLVMAVYNSVEYLTVILVTSLLIFLAFTFFSKRAIFGVTSRGFLFLLLALILAPGLLVNTISKNAWGRARPAHIEQFGGAMKFTPAFICADQCSKNCSFVSGHSSLGFYLLSFALVSRNHRKKIFAAAFGYGTMVGLVRIYQGGHFLSDVVFSFFFVYTTIRILYFILFEAHPKMPQSEEMETGRFRAIVKCQ